MRNSTRLVFICVCMLSGGLIASGWAYTSPRVRMVRNLNKSWQFIRQDVAVSQATAASDPSNWSSINLPHSFDIPYWRANKARSPQVGWYRKHITVDQSVIDAKKRVFIEFEAAFQIAFVYVNGTMAGMHKGGFTGFSFDITPHIQAGDNVIAVRLDARWSDTIAPIGGDHIFIGGIYRNVSLVVTDPLHVTWYGTFVTTPQVSEASATVKVKTEIRNDGTATADCRVKTVIADSAGMEVTSFETTRSVAAGATVTLVQSSNPISNPQLWSPSSPYMYTVHTEVYNGTSIADNFESPLGIRWFKWTMNNGFELNGKKVWLQGANVHQDRAGWCDAGVNTGSYRDVRLIKECGMNFIRGSHYPHAPAFSDACDQLGICLWSEAPLWGCLTGSEDWKRGCYANNDKFKKSCLDQTREMIRIHRNHPSIIVWSMGNELWFTSDLGQTVSLLTQMVGVSHEEDSTRPAGVGGVQLNTADFARPCDVVGFNGGFLHADAGVPSLVSEYGADCWDRGENYNACWGDQISSPPSADQYGWRAGYAIWCGFNYGSIYIGTNGYSDAGMIDHARLPQKRWYFYRNFIRGIAPPAWPVNGTPAKLKLTTDRDTITDDGTSDALLIVEVQDASGKWLSNSPDITLTDKSGLGAFPTGQTISFVGGAKDRCVRNGQASIEYRSYKAGTVTIEATSGNLDPGSITLTVLSVADDEPVVASRIKAALPVTGALKEMVTTGIGNRIVLPDGMAGNNVSVTLFDMRGRLIGHVTPQRNGRIERRDIADGIIIARAKRMLK